MDLNLDTLRIMCSDEKELDRLMAAGQTFVETRLAGTGTADLMPHLYIATRTAPDAPVLDRLYAIDLDFNEDAEKREIMRRLGREIYAQKTFPIAAAFWSEAWAAPEGRESGVEPRHHPERKEVCLVIGATLAGGHTRAIRIPVRRENGNMVQAGPAETRGEARLPTLAQFFLGFAAAVEAALRK